MRVGAHGDDGQSEFLSHILPESRSRHDSIDNDLEARPNPGAPDCSKLLAAMAERGFVILGDAMAEAVAVSDTRERLLASKDEHPALKDAAQRAFRFVLAADAHDKQHGASLALAGWSLAHGLGHLMIDGAFEGLPMKKQNPDTLARKLSERMF